MFYSTYLKRRPPPTHTYIYRCMCMRLYLCVRVPVSMCVRVCILISLNLFFRFHLFFTLFVLKSDIFLFFYCPFHMWNSNIVLCIIYSRNGVLVFVVIITTFQPLYTLTLFRFLSIRWRLPGSIATWRRVEGATAETLWFYQQRWGY